MIIFDPKGELYNITGGFRSKFSRVLKFSPVSKETVRFNPMDEIELTEQAFADIGLILANVFEEPKGGNDGASQFFDNAAKDLLTGLIFHVISCGKYPKSQQNLSGVLEVLSIASAQKIDANGNECAAGDVLLDEMINSKHFDRDGNESAYIHRIIQNSASRAKSMHEKVRSDTFSTVFTKMNLFEDPYIKYVTGESDFKLQDFYDSPEPISLYLTVPFSHIDRIAPVFKLIINFILRKFSSGEMRAGEKEKKLKNRIMFLLDEFVVLGAIPFISKTMGILAGYGINFFIIVQALNQIVDLYGQNHTFLDNCKTVCVFAPGKIEDAKAFSEMLGKESILKESMSSSGSRYSLSLDNLNSSAQDIARELLNPDELMHMSQEYALILNQGMSGYLAKKNVYYMDKRLKWKAYNVDKNGSCISGWPAPYSREEIELIVQDLPSNKNKAAATCMKVLEGAKKANVDTTTNVIKIFNAQENNEDNNFLSKMVEEQESYNPDNDDSGFSVADFFNLYDEDEDMEEWQTPLNVKDPKDSPPPAVKSFTVKDFSKKKDD